MTPRHGTLTGYCVTKCRCDECRAAMRDYQRARRDGLEWHSSDPDYEAMRDLLLELAPDGLTDDAPIRRARRKVAA